MLKKILLTLTTLITLAGCASSSNTLNLAPNIALPVASAAANHAASVAISITSTDQRADPALAKINRDGHLISLTASHDPRFLLQEALEKQMTARGYQIAASSAVNVQIIIDQLYADVSQGDLRYQIHSHARITVIASSRNGNRFTQNYHASYSVNGAFQASNANIGKTLNIVLSNIMTDMANDARVSDFIQHNT